MIQVLIMSAGVMVEVYGLLGRRNDYAGLLFGAGGVIVGMGRPDALGEFNIALGVINILAWLNRRRRDRARRAIGNKGRAIIAAITRRMREAAPQPS